MRSSRRGTRSNVAGVWLGRDSKHDLDRYQVNLITDNDDDYDDDDNNNNSNNNDNNNNDNNNNHIIYSNTFLPTVSFK